jgi:cytoskeletal protein CcmA (bactofilin family)
MAIWKDQSATKKDVAPTVVAEPPKANTSFTPKPEFTPRMEPTPSYDTQRSIVPQGRESVIAPEISIEGKIDGAGHVRIAGKFKGDVNVQGNLTIESGAKLVGGVRAATVTIGGELEGNVDSASKVELLETGVLSGDVKAGSLTVAAGSRMRGQVEFGWEDRNATRSITPKAGSSSAA